MTPPAAFCLTLLAVFAVASPGRAQHRASGPGRYGGYEPNELPQNWRRARGDLSHVVPEPTDTPEAEAGAKLIEVAHPGRQNDLEIRVGEKLRLSPMARRERWRFISVDVEQGVLWPVPGTNRIFFARCPGTSFVHLERTVAPPPPQPTEDLSWQEPERAVLDVRVVSNGKNPAECRPDFDPPRKANPGRLTLSDVGWGISMKVGERFTLSDLTDWCRSPWTGTGSRWYEDFRLSDPTVLGVIGIEADGVHFVAAKKGITELSVPDPIRACQYNGSIPTDRFLIDVK